jgi:raffinose/stachyose/melibiose transport system substrate-binding protein
MSRKKYLLIFLSLLFLVFLPGMLYAGGENEGTKEEAKIVIWWWGEQELVGLTGWLDDTIALFEQENPNVTVEATLQATENVFSDFPTAAAAGNPPHLQYMWNGVYTLEWVWLGGVEALNKYLSADELDRMYSIPLTTFKGNAYRVGWYMFAFGWAYNKDILRKAGVSNSMIPPKTWDEWLDVCEKVKNAGYIPISMGAKDKLLGDWLQAILLYQQLDSYSDVVKLCTGELRWDAPRYYGHWTRLKELWDKGYINRDVNSVDLYQGQEMLSNGEAAFTIAVGSIVPSIQEALGAENVGYMKTPKFGVGKLADKYVIDVQGIGMAEDVENKELAADFLRLMHRQDRVNAMYTELRAFPADKSFDPGVIKDPIDKEMWDWFEEGIIYLGDVVPYAVTDGAANSGCQQLFAGTAEPRDLGKEAQRLIEEWREQNPDMLDNYLNWMK